MKFGIQLLGFNGMSNYVNAINRDADINGLLSLHESADEPFTLISFPRIKLTRNGFDYPFWRVRSSIRLRNGDGHSPVQKLWSIGEQFLRARATVCRGFLSHGGWNSVLESVSAEVPILAWPMMAEQPLNAKTVVEEIKIGLLVETVNGSGNKFVPAESLKNKVEELMEGEKGDKVRKKVKQVAEVTRNSMLESQYA
ncbi:unnamed protein product [Fraxinus pennsylvanica]|uniref:Uncharacterized protein n=1 Tax=Fraxinus pennsylvanica TaxID=56036 RepID=A0AAD2E5X9_9LAMI|nr:unnamed protein product [Fraxinus pennsylvanica]